MKSRHILLLAASFILSVSLLAVIHHTGDPAWLKSSLPAVAGADGIMWQVQTTFLSVGFAGLAIAAQLFAEAPLAIGASRGRVLSFIGAGWFVGVGLVANAVIAIETIWLPSDLGMIGIAFAWFAPSVVLLVVSTVKLMQLFGHPSLLDEVVRSSLVDSLSSRLSEVSRKYADARERLEGLFASEGLMGVPKASAVTLRVPVPAGGRVIRAINPKIARQAIDSLGLRATEGSPTNSAAAEVFLSPQVTLDIEPGDRTRLGESAFRVITSNALDAATTGRIVRLLQSSIEFEPSGSVTPDEETDREIATLKDAIGTNLRSGALATAERALELLGHVVRGVWMAERESPDSSRRASFTRRDWLFRSVGEVEQDVLLSPRVADVFVGAAMTRAIEAPRTGSTEYVDECLRSFTRLWFDVLRHGDPDFDSVVSRITTCVQNLAAYSYSAAEESDDLQARGTWAMVELVKLALDAKKPAAAKIAALELSALFEFDRGGSSRSHVRGGQLVLSGWLDYLADKHDDRDPADASLRALVTPRGTWSEILGARAAAERGAVPFSRWDWWEMKSTTSSGVQALQLSHYIDRALLSALASSYGPLPPADDQETASEYKRFLSILTDGDRELNAQEDGLKRRFAEAIAKWDAAEDGRLAVEPLSQTRIDALGTALRETLDQRSRLAAEIPVVEDVPASANTSHPILGMNFRVPRLYLVEKIFNQTFADPTELGRMIAQGFAEGEEQRIVRELRSLRDDVLEPAASAIRSQIEALASEAEYYILLAPYGGLDIHEWYSVEFREVLESVTHIETGVLDGEAILFDRRTTLTSCRKPEEKEGLSPVDGTSIAMGVFEDVQGGDEPQVRVETGEYFAVWPGDAPRVFRFGAGAVATEGAHADEESTDPAEG
ncbi:hypothetical protein [Cellulomonas alba]|uniref:DUF2254 domain-containing protein n=1 Tax=Cellulomonas alba TaxID=3053467 RepID=A0ABT7SH20_9CELL|nr:hypothetical protein [Cellulomonas alba]MDM7855493.1 hypothetical protein [Cellulomonas alba]